MRRADTVEIAQFEADRLPACPRCNDLCAYDSVVCVECGTRLRLTEDELVDLRRAVV